MELKFQIIVLAEYLLELLHDARCLLQIVVHDGLWQFAAETGRTAYQPLVILPQQLLVDTRFIVESFRPGVGDKFDEVVVSLEILGEQDEVVARFFVLVLFAVVLYHIDFASEDGFESRRVGRIVELLYAEHIAVVGNGNGRHAELLGPFHQRGDGGGPIEDGVLRMYMKMSELRHIDAYL